VPLKNTPPLLSLPIFSFHISFQFFLIARRLLNISIDSAAVHGIPIDFQ
jgi:hypothetical protein